MLTLSDLKTGTVFVMEGDPWQILETTFVKKAQSTGVLQVKIKNLKTGAVLSRSFKQADRFEEADVLRRKVKFIFAHRGNCTFSMAENPKERFELSEDNIGDDRFYLVPDTEISALELNGKIIAIELPPKVDLKVVEAPPSEKGNTAQGGKKPVKTETGLTVQAPFFINEGDVIRVNTKTGEYVERVK